MVMIVSCTASMLDDHLQFQKSQSTICWIVFLDPLMVLINPTFGPKPYNKDPGTVMRNVRYLKFNLANLNNYSFTLDSSY